MLLSVANMFSVGWQQWLCGGGLPMTTAVVYVECSLTPAVQTANCREMTVLLVSSHLLF